MPTAPAGAAVQARSVTGLPALRPTALDFLAPELPALALPLRGPLLGMEGFRVHARALAQAEPVERRRGWRRARRVPFRPPVEHNLRVLQRAAAHLQALGDAGQPPSAAALALAQQLQRLAPRLPALRQALGTRAFVRLPAWRAEPLAGLPRIYGIAWSFVTHTDANLDANLLLQCLLAYQEVDELGIEELQAVPLALRAVLLENAARLVEAMASREAAAEWADLCVADDDPPPPEALDALCERLARRGVEDAFVARLAQGLAQRPPSERRLLRDWLQRHSPDSAAALARWQAAQAADEVSLRHAVASLVEVDRLDWRSLIDPASVVLQRLSQSEAFCGDDLATRERCLQAVAQVAHRMGRPQGEVAQRALELSEADAESRRLGPAQFLIGPRRHALLQALGHTHHLPVLSRGQRSLAYLGGLVLGTLVLIVRMLTGDVLVPWAELLTVVLLAVPASEVVAVLLQRLLAALSPALPLPRLALDEGFRPEHRTLVVLPCVLRSSQQVAVLAQRLEQHWLANRERHTQFALLSDWADAPERQASGDALLLDAARTAVAVLNARHPRSGDDDSEPRFLLLHRERSWSASEGAWIGWDRGRGQREQLLAHLAGATPSPFLPLGEDSRLARRIAHVLTLGPDSVLPPGGLHELVAVAAHPMNAPVVDEAQRRVVAGHAVLQPRLAAPLASAPAMQPPPEALPAPGVHQRLFGDSRFLGQGLLHVQAFHAVNAGRVPEDRLPDAALFEGLWARCAEVPEVVLLQTRPVDAEAAHAAQQRRTRLTWQLLPLWPQALHGRVGLLNLWRLLDGLRRSLLAPACVLLLWWSFTLQAVPPGRTMLLVLAALALRPALQELSSARGPGRWSLRGLCTALRWRAPRLLSLVAWQFLGLMPRALADAEAIAQSLWRQAVSRRRLLQPVEPLPTPTAAAGLDPRLWSHVPDLPAAIAAAGFTLSGLLIEGAAWGWLTLVGLAWLLTPALPGALAEALERRRQGGPAHDPAHLHLLHLARDSWRAFERLPSDDPQALPPERFELGAVLRPSHRSSPATLGLTLLATSCAHRLGLIGTRDLLQRVAALLDALERLPRHHGHLHQWCDTHTRAVLAPARIDTVDSGVLAACLWATAQACRELAAGPAPHAARETAINAALARLRHGGDPGLRELLQQAPLRALLAQDLWALWRRSPGKLRTLLAAAQVASGAPAPLQPGPLSDLLGQLDSLLSDREDDRDRWPARLRSLATRLDALVEVMDFGPLYDPHRRLLHTGLRTDDALREEAVHDSLLGAARLAGFVAIAKGDLPVAHWAALDRRLAAPESLGTGEWSDPLAQALLPGLLLDEPPGSVLQRGAAAALAASELPEEANEHTRRLSPWQALLALPLDAAGGLARLQRLERLGARSTFGLVSCLTLPGGRDGRRQPPQPSDTVVLAELAGGIAAITHRLADAAPRRWFGAVPAVRAHLPLLQEAPRPGVRPAVAAPPLVLPAAAAEPAPLRELDPTHLSPAQAPTQLLGNGRYTVALQPHGGGASRWRGQDVHRWRDDLLRGVDGHWLLLRSGDEVEYHSLTRAPHPRPDAFYRTRFHDDRVEYDADCDFWRSTVTAWVGADEDIEFRQVSLQNLESHPVAFELLSMVEVALAPAGDGVRDAASAALEAEAADAGTLTFRRPGDGAEPWCVAHFLAQCDAEPVSLRLIADRRRLLPRHGDLTQARPGAGQAGEPPVPLDTGGDPVAAIAVRLVVPAQSRLCVTFATAAGRDADTLRAWADEFRRDVHLQRSRRMASALLRLQQESWHFDGADRDALQNLCTGLVGSRAQSRPAPTAPADPERLLRLGLDPQARLLLVRLAARSGVPALQTLRRACRAWAAAGMEVALAVIDATPMDVEQRVLGALPPLRHDLAGEDLAAPQERLHLWRIDSLPPEDLAALQAAARVDLMVDGQPLPRVVAAAWRSGSAASHAAAAAAAGHDDTGLAPDRRQRAALVEAPLEGERAPWRFADGGSSLRLHLDRRRTTPEAWRLPLGRSAFGAVVSESGGGHTWAGTPSRPLTSAADDALLDPAAEHFLLQDLLTRETWGLLPTLDRNGLEGYEVLLQPGRACWTQRRGPLEIEAELALHPEAPAKVLRVRLHNGGTADRALRAAAMVEWVLGRRRAGRMTVLSEFVPSLPALLAHQRGGGQDVLPGVAMLMLVGPPAQQWTAARDEWFDAGGRLRLPRTLAGADGGALDPCAALDTVLTLAAGESAEFAWVIAHADDRAQALALGAELGSLEALRRVPVLAQEQAPRGVGGLQLQVQTPDIAFDGLVNHWLPWQLREHAVAPVEARQPAAANGRRRNGPAKPPPPWTAFCHASPAHEEVGGLRRKPLRAAPFMAPTAEAAWQLYGMAVEGVLGCRVQEGRITVSPALPPHWRKALVCLSRGSKLLYLHLREPTTTGDEARLQRLAPGASLAWDELPAESHWLVQMPSSRDAEDRRPPTLVEA